MLSFTNASYRNCVKSETLINVTHDQSPQLNEISSKDEAQFENECSLGVNLQTKCDKKNPNEHQGIFTNIEENHFQIAELEQMPNIHNATLKTRKPSEWWVSTRHFVHTIFSRK